MDAAVCLMMPPDALAACFRPVILKRQGNARGRENGRGAQKREIESVSIILSEFPLICTPSLRRRGVCPHVSAPTNPGARVGLEEAC